MQDKRNLIHTSIALLIMMIRSHLQKRHQRENDNDRRKKPRMIINRNPNLMRDPLSLLQYHLGTYSQKFFRLPKELFFEIVNYIKLQIAKHMKSWRVNGQAITIPVELKLMITLRFLAGGIYSDIAHLFGVANSTVYAIVKETIAAINNCEKLRIRFPSDEVLLDQIDKGFASRSHGFIKGCIGAIDGLRTKIVSPNQTSTSKSRAYIDKDGNNSILSIVLCNDFNVITYFQTEYCGSTHDNYSFENSSLHKMFSNLSELKKNNPSDPALLKWNNRFIIGDSAFSQSEFLIKPYSQERAMKVEACSMLNNELARMRVEIERTFGEY